MRVTEIYMTPELAAQMLSKNKGNRQLRARQAEHDKATATLRAEQRGAQAAYLAAIKAFLEASR